MKKEFLNIKKKNKNNCIIMNLVCLIIWMLIFPIIKIFSQYIEEEKLKLQYSSKIRFINSILFFIIWIGTGIIILLY